MNRNFAIAFIVLLAVVVGVYVFRQNSMKLQEQSAVTAKPEISPAAAENIVFAVYKGTQPCADCEGIDTVLTLNQNETYTMTSTFLGKETAPYSEKGKWKTLRGDASDPNAVVYQLYERDGTQSVYENYLLQGDKILPLDDDLKPIDSPFDMSLSKRPAE